VIQGQNSHMRKALQQTTRVASPFGSGLICQCAPPPICGD
jgi:hypothetical protein